MSNNIPLGLDTTGCPNSSTLSPQDNLAYLVQDTVCFLEVPTCLFSCFTWQILLEEIKQVDRFLVQFWEGHLLKVIL